MRDMTRQLKLSVDEQARGGQQISKSVGDVTERVQQIADAVNAQKTGTEVIVKAIQEIRGIASDNVKLVDEMDQAVESLTEQADLLKGEIDKFKMQGSEA
jgi:methyl-accepting chemotaxis protein